MSYPHYHKVILPVRINIQDNNYDCGPASLKIVLETLGKKSGEKRLMQLAKTSKETGTDTNNMSKTLAELAVSHRVEYGAKIEDIEKALYEGKLCIVLYQAWGKGGSDFKNYRAGHYSVIFGQTPKKFYLADPGKVKKGNGHKGVRTMQKEYFNKKWAGRRSDGTLLEHWLMTVVIGQ